MMGGGGPEAGAGVLTHAAARSVSTRARAGRLAVVAVPDDGNPRAVSGAPPLEASRPDHAAIPVVVGLSHRTATLDLLERCAMRGPARQRVADDLARTPALSETAVLSTCNRVEVYVATRDPLAARAEIGRALADVSGMAPDDLLPAVYAHVGDQAARHLFRVVSSLDSMVLGENEIQGQVRRAWVFAGGEGTSGPLLDLLFRQALQVGRRVRRDTRLGMGRVSIPSVAVDLTACSGSLEDRAILVVGAGSMGKGLAIALGARRAGRVVIASRNPSNAALLAAPRGWRAVALDAVANELRDADIVMSATSSPAYVVTRADVEQALRTRVDRPMTIVDLALPRDVDPEVADLGHVELRDLDEIHRMARAGAAERQGQAALAEAIVDREVERFALVHRQRLMAASRHGR